MIMENYPQNSIFEGTRHDIPPPAGTVPAMENPILTANKNNTLIA